MLKGLRDVAMVTMSNYCV